MRCRPLFPLVLAALVLAACSKEPAATGGGGTPDAGADRPEPGLYRTTTKIVDASMPGMPADRAAHMKNMFGANGHSVEFCLTPQEADKGFGEFNKRAADGRCSYDSLQVGGGQIDARMTCQTGRGMTATSQMRGTYSRTGSKLTMKTDTSAPALPGGGMHMEAEVISERIGDCP